MIRTFLALTLTILLFGTSAQAQDVTPTATQSLSTLEAVSIPATVYQTVNVRRGPDTRYEIIGQLSEGDRITVVGRNDEDSHWLHVRLDDGSLGWVPSFVVFLEGDPATLPVIMEEAAQPLPSGDGSVVVVAYGRVNVRSGPDMNYDIIGQIDVNEQAQVLARSNDDNDWLFIEHDTFQGWVAFFTVRIQGDLTTIPIRVPDGGSGDLVSPSILVEARFNVRLHSEPTLDSPVIMIIPFDSRVTPLARSEDNRWLYMTYEGASGWGVANLFDISETQTAAIPVYAPEALTTPEAVATVTATAEATQP